MQPYTGTGSYQTINGKNYSVPTPAVGTAGYQTINGVNYNATVGGGVAVVSPNNVYTGGGASVPAVPASTPVTLPATTIGTQPIGVPSVPVVSGSAGAVAGNNISLGLNADGSSTTKYNPDGTPIADTSTTTPVADTTKPKKSLSDYLTSMLGLQPKTNSAQQDLIDSQNQAGLNAAQIQKNNTQSQINGITAKLNADLLSVRGADSANGVTTAVYGGQQAEINREATIQLLPLQAQLATDQGNLDLATKMASDLYQAKREDATTAVNQWNTAYKMAFDQMTNDQKTQADALKQTYDTNTSQLNTAIDHANALSNTAFANGQGALGASIMQVSVPNSNSTVFNSDVNTPGSLAYYNAQVAALAGQIKPKKATDTQGWTAPYTMGNTTVQRNTTTGEIRTVISAPNSTSADLEQTINQAIASDPAFKKGTTQQQADYIRYLGGTPADFGTQYVGL